MGAPRPVALIRRNAGVRYVGRPPELSLHLAVVDALEKLGDPSWRWTHFPAGERRDERTGAKLKRMGVKPGWPDLLLVSPRGVLHGLELKKAGGKLTAAQDEFRGWCIGRGVPHAIAYSIDEALQVLTAWGCLRRAVSA